MGTFKLKLKIIVFFLGLILSAPCFAIIEYPSKYDSIYNGLHKLDYEFINGEDPQEFYEQENYITSPYPLIKNTSFLSCQDVKIEPSYYLLTPRELNGNHYVLFKQKGEVKAAIPVYEIKMIDKNIEYPQPKPPKTPLWKKPWQWFKTGVAKLFGGFKKPPAPILSKLEAYDLDHIYYEIDLYYNDYEYKMIFKKV